MANRIKNAFDAVHAEDSLKAKTRTALRKRMSVRTLSFVSRRLIVSFACLLLVLIGFGGTNLYFTPASAISIDVNPSIELGVNRFGRVVKVTGYNEDGEQLARVVDLRYMEYTAAIERLMTSPAMADYLSVDSLVSITVIGGTDAESEAMRSRIASCDYTSAGNVRCQCGNRQMVSEAHEAGLSVGKYQVFLQLREADPSITVEDVTGLSMREMRDWLDRLTGSTQDDAPNGQHGRYGNGGEGQKHGK